MVVTWETKKFVWTGQTGAVWAASWRYLRTRRCSPTLPIPHSRVATAKWKVSGGGKGRHPYFGACFRHPLFVFLAVRVIRLASGKVAYFLGVFFSNVDVSRSDFIASVREQWMFLEHCCSDTDRGNRRTRRETCTSNTLSSTNPKLTCLG